jgi:hypothetical protein
MIRAQVAGRWLAVTGMVLAVARCGFAGGGEFMPCAGAAVASGFAETDSAGVVIRTTGCEDAQQPLGWSVDDTPELTIGDGGEAQEFERVLGVVALPDGGVAVLERGSREVRFFGAGGELVARRGRAGQGPGEFRAMAVVRQTGSDSVAVFDWQSRRLTVFAAQGAGPPMTTLVPRYGARGPVVVGQVGDLLLHREEVLDALRASTLLGIYEQDITFLWSGLAWDTAVVLQHYRVDTIYIMNDPVTGVRTGQPYPFAVDPQGAVRSAGPILTSGAQHEILVFDTAGRLASKLQVPRRRRPASRQEYDRYMQFLVEHRGFSTVSPQIIAAMPLPDSMPAFSGLKVDDRGWIWAELYGWDTRLPAVWMVFDTAGRARGTVEVPAGLHVHDIRGGFIVGVVRDSLQVEHVRRHRLHRN